MIIDLIDTGEKTTESADCYNLRLILGSVSRLKFIPEISL